MTTRVALGRWFVAVLVCVLWAVGSTEVAGAVCLAPQIEVSPATAEPGDRMTVAGTGFITECNDVVLPDEPPPPPSLPETGIDIVFVQGEHRVVLATVDADASYGFRVAVTVPVDAASGPATVQAIGDSLSQAEAAITVSSPRVPELPRTGGPLNALTAVGLGLILLGLWACRNASATR
jgi:hypothetical protein